MKQEQKLRGFSSREEREEARRAIHESPRFQRLMSLGRKVDSGQATREEFKEYEDLTWEGKTNPECRIRPEGYPRAEFFPYKKLSDRIEEFAGDFVKRGWVHAASGGGPPTVTGYYETQDGSIHVMPSDDPELTKIAGDFWNTCAWTDWDWYDMTFRLSEDRYRDAHYSFTDAGFGRHSEYEDEADWIRRNLGEVELIRH